MYDIILHTPFLVESGGTLLLNVYCFMVVQCHVCDVRVHVYSIILLYEWKLSVHLHLLKITFDVAFKTESTCIM